MVQDILLNPNVAYLILVVGVVLTMMAILSPGTGVLEIAALFFLALAAYTIYYIPINYWALAIIVVGAILFGLAVRKSKNLILLGVSIVMFIIGSIFLFTTKGWQPAVNPILATVTSLLVGGFLWLVARKLLETEKIKPAHDPNALIGQIGEAKTSVYEDGSIQVGGELWSARSNTKIPPGGKVKVIGREGFFLLVEEVEES
jgi:membrane-bound serine protease (ClpP class)